MFVVLYLRAILLLLWSYLLVSLLLHPVDSYLWLIYGNVKH
jgi:hypothetical protein